MDSNELLTLLANKHSKDVFVSECKNGPSWGGGCCRLDGWAMSKSWAHPLTTGYEIKVSRADFLKDEKWPQYLPYCNEFYFVCPTGLIQPNELPQEVGLYYVSSTGTKLFCKKKAVYRTIEIPEEFYRYILMCRVKIVSSTLYYGADTDADYWKLWLQSKQEGACFGHLVGKRIHKFIEKEILGIKVKNEELRAENQKLQEIKERLKVLGLDTEQGVWALKRDIERLNERRTRLLPQSFVCDVDELIRQLMNIKSQLKTEDK